MLGRVSSVEPGLKVVACAGMRQIERRRRLAEHNRALRGGDFHDDCEAGLGAEHDPVQAEPQGLQSAPGGGVTVQKADFCSAGLVDQHFPPQTTCLGRRPRGGEQGNRALQPKDVPCLVQIVNNDAR
jgi:hypothetical protein